MGTLQKLEIASIYGAATKKGLVEIQLNEQRMQVDLPKAREILGMLAGAIEAAAKGSPEGFAARFVS